MQPLPSPPDPDDRMAGVRVTYPELRRLRSVSATLIPAAAGLVSSLFPGVSRSVYHGKGLEFHESRIYQPGDDFRNLDWRVSARSGALHTKVFQEEREHTLFLLLDARPSMQFGTRNAFKWVVAARAAALFSWLALAEGERLGGAILQPEGGLRWHRPSLGEADMMHFFRLLAAVKPEPPQLGRTIDLADALERLRHGIQPGASVMILSDFQLPIPVLGNALSSLLQRHQVAALSLFDPMETTLPAIEGGAFTDGEKWLRLDTLSPALDDAFRQQFQQHQAQVADLFHHHNCRFLTLGTHQELVPTLRQQLLRHPDG